MATNEAQAEQGPTDEEWLLREGGGCVGAVILAVLSAVSSPALKAAARAMPYWAQALVLVVAFGALTAMARLRKGPLRLRMWLRPVLNVIYMAGLGVFLFILRAAYPPRCFWGFLLLLLAVGLPLAGLRAWRKRRRPAAPAAPWDP